MSTNQNPGCIAGKQRSQAAFTDLRLALPELPEESLPEFLGNLARLEAEARIRLNAPRQTASSHAESCDRLLGVKAAADRLGISTSQLYRTADDFPFTIRSGRTLRFSSFGISRWIEKRAR